MKINLPNAVTSRLAVQSLKLQKHSPRILFGTGIVLMGATVVSASKATLQLEETLDEITKRRELIALAHEDNPEEYGDRFVQRANLVTTTNGLAKIAKLYLPSIALGVAAVGCLTTSHNQLTRRNAGLSAALAATERALDSYRSRVRDGYGEDRERELWRGEYEETVPVLDDEGRETKSKKKIKRGGGHSPYAVIWGRDTTQEWDPIPEYNLAKLRAVQSQCTMLLNYRGYLFLNEVYRELGLPDTPAGQQVGWLSEKMGGKDGYIDFGIMRQGAEPKFVDFLTGDEEHILLDFNVDGEIWRKI